MSGDAPAFACDAMLGGLARWLRAAGYDASDHPGIPDPDLIALCHATGRVLLSSDAGIFQDARVRDGAVRSLRMPQGLPATAQLGHVLRTLALPLREPRCMACGGELVDLPRDEARAEVPATTFATTDRFWRCAGCRQALWRGAHWRRIERALSEALGT